MILFGFACLSCLFRQASDKDTQKDIQIASIYIITNLIV
jgi:hypothetical protein